MSTNDCENREEEMKNGENVELRVVFSSIWKIGLRIKTRRIR